MIITQLLTVVSVTFPYLSEIQVNSSVMSKNSEPSSVLFLTVDIFCVRLDY